MLPMMAPAIASFAGGLGKGVGDAIGGGGPMSSSGSQDARSGMDGSGWTVSTGGGKAVGGARTGGMDMSGAPSGPIGQAPGLATMAGLGGMGTLLLVGLAVYFIARGGKL